MKKISILTFIPLSIEVSGSIVQKIPVGAFGKFEFKHENYIYQLLFRFSYTQYELDILKGIKWVELCAKTQEILNNIKRQQLPILETFRERIEDMYASGLRIGSSRDVLLKTEPMIQKSGHLLHHYVISLDTPVRDTMLKSDYINRTWLI